MSFYPIRSFTAWKYPRRSTKGRIVFIREKPPHPLGAAVGFIIGALFTFSSHFAPFLRIGKAREHSLEGEVDRL